MNKQKILFTSAGEHCRDEAYKIKLPKVIQNVSSFEMQFGMKHPGSYRCRHGKPESVGIESISIPGYTNNIRL